MKRTIITSISLLLLTTTVFALDPLGPPMATPNKEQFIAGLEYLYSEMDLHADSLTVATPLGNLQFPSAELKAIKMNKFYLNILTMFDHNYDLFLRLGITDINPDKSKNQDNLAGSIGDSDSGFTFGGGLRTTLFQSADGKEKWGLLAQLSFAQCDFANKTYLVNGSDVLISKTTLDMFDIQIAAGPTYQISDKLSVYGGPFLHFVQGEIELSGKVNDTNVKDSSEIEQLSKFGGFIGLSTDLAKNTKFNIEFQLTDDAQAAGFRFIHRF